MSPRASLFVFRRLLLVRGGSYCEEEVETRSDRSVDFVADEGGMWLTVVVVVGTGCVGDIASNETGVHLLVEDGRRSFGLFFALSCGFLGLSEVGDARSRFGKIVEEDGDGISFSATDVVGTAMTILTAT